MLEQPAPRRATPEPLSDPPAEDRAAIEQLHADAAEARRAEAEANAAAAEPVGEPPSDAQRQAILTIEQRSAERRAAAARALRRHPVAVGVVYQDERDQVAELHRQAHESRLQDMAERGIVDPNFETAGFAPDLEGGYGSAVYGTFECSVCGGVVERSFPGSPDPDAASRDVVCPHCGARFIRGGAPASAEATARVTEALPTGEPVGQPAATLSADERRELDELRQWRAEHERAEAGPAGEASAETTTSASPAEATPTEPVPPTA